MRAALSPDRQTFTLTGTLWRGTFPVAQLPDHIQLYRSLCRRDARKPGDDGPYARFHRATLDSLDAIARDLRTTGKDQP